MKISKLITAVSFCYLSVTLHATPFLIINEVFYDEVGSDGASVFTELYGEPGLDLDNWSLIGINGSNGSIYKSFALSGYVPDSGLFLLNGSDWQNGPDAIQLIYHDALSNMDILVDALQYGNISTGNFGEGDYAPDVSAGSSLSRKYSGIDTDDNSMDFIVLTNPTPGIAPPAFTVPEPGSLILMILGLSGLLFQKNRNSKTSPSTIRYRT